MQLANFNLPRVSIASHNEFFSCNDCLSSPFFHLLLRYAQLAPTQPSSYTTPCHASSLTPSLTALQPAPSTRSGLDRRHRACSHNSFSRFFRAPPSCSVRAHMRYRIPASYLQTAHMALRRGSHHCRGAASYNVSH